MQTVTTLVERSAQLDVLREAAERVRPGAGAVALVTGEAGIGKTALVRAFAADLPPHWVVLSGGCDDLLTPRPLGPLRDVARDGPHRRCGPRSPTAPATTCWRRCWPASRASSRRSC
jgi:hypothetical protein